MICKQKTVIGLTGGIGSGKTAVLDILKKEYDATIIEADKLGHELQLPEHSVYMDIIACFGENILDEPKTVGVSRIDRKSLGNIVFNDSSKLAKLNQIMHPAIHKMVEQIIADSNSRLIVVEAAILTSTSLVDLVDEVWYIYCHRDVRIDRLKKYRGLEYEKALSVMNNQPSEEEFIDNSKVRIDNSGSIDETRNQISKALERIYEEELYG